VLRIPDVYPGSEFFPSRIHPVFHPGSRFKKLPGSASASKNLCIFTQKNCFRILNTGVSKSKIFFIFEDKISSTTTGKKYLQQIVAQFVWYRVSTFLKQICFQQLKPKLKSPTVLKPDKVLGLKAHFLCFKTHSCKSLAKYLLLNLVQHLPDVVHSCGRLLLPLLLLHGLVLLPLLLGLHAHHHCRRHSRRQAHLARNGDEHCVNVNPLHTHYGTYSE
jgi:hypothetical protein